jgi:GAF domain-containing protein
MFALKSTPFDSKPAFYADLVDQAGHLLDGETDRIANAANFSSLLYHALADVNWVGFYFYDGRELIVGPFQGKPACVRISLNRGVCGAAARLRQTQRVADVHAFPGHIACDSASRSEIVIPLVQGDTLIGVLDIDSPILNRFDAEDEAGLSALAEVYLRAWHAGAAHGR